jgi:hypothetical protein
MLSRRRFLHAASAAAGAIWLPARAAAWSASVRPEIFVPSGVTAEPELSALAAKAVDAARAAGAAYADVRLTYTESQS